MASPFLSPIDVGPTQAGRVKGFATFFKSYMSVWTLVVAALPIPVAAFKLIPTFDDQRSYLSVYTSLFCFLSLGFIFFQRHRMGSYMFRPTGKWVGFKLNKLSLSVAMFNLTRGFVNWLPLACIFLSVYAVFRYQGLFGDALLVAQAQATAERQEGTLPSAFASDMQNADFATQVKLANLILFENRALLAALASVPQSAPAQQEITIVEAADSSRRYSSWTWGSAPQIAREYALQSVIPKDIVLTRANAKAFVGVGAKVPTFDEVLKTKAVPFSNRLMVWYLTIFIAAETAFILMALKEYLQDLAHISDLSLMGIDAKGVAPSNEANVKTPSA